MKLKPAKLAPALITIGVITLVCIVRLLKPGFFERPELITYDIRVQEALRFAPPASTNLGLVYISDQTIKELRDGLLGRPIGLQWPRRVYGQVIRELAAQEARTVGLDVVFDGRRPDHNAFQVSLAKWPDAQVFVTELNEDGGRPVIYGAEEPSGAADASKAFPDQADGYAAEAGERLLLMESDHYFAWQLRRARIAILAADKGVQPDPLFASNVLAVADISAHRDADGVLRRARVFSTYTNWHPCFLEIERQREYAVDLQLARVEGTNIILPRPEGLDPIMVPIDEQNNFELSDISSVPAGWPARDKAFTTERIWHMGVVLAAQELGLDLSRAEVNLEKGNITLSGANGLRRIIPVDRNGYFYINWELPYADPRITKAPFEELLEQDRLRTAGITNDLVNRWQNRLVLVGSVTVGNDLTDRGTTPLEKDTILVSKHWNVANSIIADRFVHRSAAGIELLLAIVLGGVTAVLTMKLRTLSASGATALLIVAYLTVSLVAYVQQRYWLPVVLPIATILVTHVALVTWCVVFAQAEQRRVRSIFSRIVSPDIVNELLQAEKLSLGGARREVTVLFADVRGFTEFTDRNQDLAAAYVAENRLTGADVEACFNAQARETLNTVNSYLGLVADMVKKHDGTLDKYIGDCVMAFWGAPVSNPRHALCCVRAAIDAQRAMHEFNQQRTDENQRREVENRARVSAGLPPRPMLPTLLLGSGINTGLATVGLMGSEAHISNYTVFGREVNLASRLETRSGRGRILISEATFKCLLRDDPQLAAACSPLPMPQELKGFRTAVLVYEVPWRLPGSIVLPAEVASDTAFKSDTSTIARPDIA